MASRGRSSPCRLGAEPSPTAPENPHLLLVQPTWGPGELALPPVRGSLQGVPNLILSLLTSWH